MAKIPPLTDEWLQRHMACDRGYRRFHRAAPNGSLVMDDYGAAMLARFCVRSDLSWLLHKIIGFNYFEVKSIAQWHSWGDERDYIRRMAAACVAAWREYHQ